MERKRFMSAMDLTTHATWKALSAKAGVHGGDLLDNFLKGLEAKIARAYKKTGCKISVLNDQQIIFALLDADRLGWSEAKLTKVLMEFKADETDDEWTDIE